MSSLAAARADGFYYPPSFDPETHGTLNRFQGSHPLGERAKDIHLGILVVRFEMPFKVSCLSCETIVDKGVRFNAQKKRVGSYFSTPVYSFAFSCPSCNHPFVITTDPKRSRYLCTQGLKQRLGDEPDEASGNLRLLQPEERERLAANPVLAREEKLLSLRQRQLLLLREEERRLAEEETPQQQQQRERISSQRLAAAQLLQQQQADDYAANRRMRQQLQQRKRAAAAAATAAAAEEGVEVEADEACLRDETAAAAAAAGETVQEQPERQEATAAGGKRDTEEAKDRAIETHDEMRGAPLHRLEGALKQQQALALEGPLKAQLQQLGGPTEALKALSTGRSQEERYLLLLALIKKTCSSEAWRTQLGEEGETREQLLLLLQQQLDSLAAAVNAYRAQQQKAEEALSPQLTDTTKDDGISSSSSSSSSSTNSSNSSSSNSSSSNSSSSNSSSSSGNNSSSSSRVVEVAGVLCVFIRLLRNLCVKPLFVEALLSKGVLSRLVSGAQVVETCSVASRLLVEDPAVATAAAAAAANQATAADEGTLSASAAAEPPAAAAAAAASPCFFSLPFLCAEALLLPQSLLQLLGNAAAAASAAPLAAAAGDDGGRKEIRSQIWKAVGRLQLLELAVCSYKAALRLTEEPLLEVILAAAAAAAAAATAAAATAAN
ncbi:hypothetical protein Emed_004116 [Eimeria media]